MSELLNQLVGLKAKEQTTQSQQAINEEQVQEVVDVSIEENALYNLINNDELDDSEIIEKIAELLARNEDLTEEENYEKIRIFAELNRHYQDQMISLARRQADFSNDEALSMYDKVVESLQQKLGVFSNDIKPLVTALGVIKKAEDGGLDPQELLAEVAELRRRQEVLIEEVKQLETDLHKKGLAIEEAGDKASKLRKSIETNRTLDIDMKEQKRLKKKELAEMKDGFFKRIFNSESIEDHEKQIKRLETRLEANREEESQNVKELEDLREKLSKLEAADQKLKEVYEEASEELESLTDKLQGNSDTHALNKLIEITGAEYKGKREGLVDNAKQFIEDAISEFNSCISRFGALENEIGDFSKVAGNLIQSYFLLIKGAEEGYKITDSNLKETEASYEQMYEEEKKLELSVSSPEVEKLSKNVKSTKTFLNDYLPNKDSAVNFRRILAERESEFTGLKGLVTGKRIDAEELRTNGAVAVASQLVMTLKSLEAAIAGQKTETLRSMLGTFSSVANAATEDVLNNLIKDQDKRNSRLVEALEGLVNMKDQLDDVTDKLLESRTGQAGLIEAVVVATDDVAKSSDNLKNTMADGRRIGKEKVGDEEARQIIEEIKG